MRRIKICQLITTLGPAGAERCVCQLAGKLDKSRFDVSVVSLMGGAVEQEIKRSGVPVVCLDMRCKYDIFRFARLGAVLKWLGPDILHTHLFHADFAGRIFSFFSGQRRLVTTVHVAEMRFRPWQFVIARLLSGCCDKTICVSPSVMEFHSRRSGLPRSRYHIIMNGVDTSVFVPDASGGGEFRRRMSIPADELTLSFAGRLDRQKGLDVLFDALRILSRQGRRLNLLIAGDGPLRPMLEEFLRSIPPGINARYLGHINNVAEMFAASDIFVMPSRWEGYGLSAAEAMSVAIPVIGTRIDGLVDVVQDGRTGILVPPENPDALADAIIRLADDRAFGESLGREGRKFAVENLGIERFVTAHEKLYTDLMCGYSAGVSI